MNHDIALVRFADINTTNVNSSSLLPGVVLVAPGSGVTLSGTEIIKRFKEVELGADVFLLGYPTSLTGRLGNLFDSTRPLLRKGIVAGINNVSQKIILDCAVYQGNSGGPVLQLTRPAINMTSMHIIGIATEFIPFTEVWENKQFNYANLAISNSGYSVVEPMDAILDLIWK